MVMHFDDEAVRSALRWDDLIRAMENALTDFTAGRVMQPLRNWLAVEEGSRYLGVMPAATRTFTSSASLVPTAALSTCTMSAASGCWRCWKIRAKCSCAATAAALP